MSDEKTAPPPAASLRPRGGPWLLALGLYAGLCLLALRPVWNTWTDHLPGSGDDPRFNLYVLKWAAHQFELGFPDFWNANVFYPTPRATTFSDHLIGPGVALALLLRLLPDAVAGYNVLMAAAFLLTALATCWVARRAGLGWAAALFAGWAFAFSPFRLSHATHLQLLLAMWLPLTLWFWDRLWAEPNRRHGLLFLLFYLLHLTGGTYLAYMIHVPLLVLALNRLVGRGGRVRLPEGALRVVLPVVGVMAAAGALLFLPYLRTARELGLGRGLGEIWRFGATAASYLSPEPSLLWFGPRAAALLERATGPLAPLFARTENALFAGFLPTALAVVGVVAAWRRLRVSPVDRPLSRGRRALLGALLLLALAGYLRGDAQTLARAVPGSHPHLERASWVRPVQMVVVPLLLVFALRRVWKTGPLLRLEAMDPWDRGLALSGLTCFALTHPIVYLPLMRVVPGLAGMRVPARFSVFVSLALVWFAARGLEVWLARVGSPRGRAVLAGALLLGLGAELTARPLSWEPIPPESRFPPVYAWLAERRDVRALLEIPLYRDGRETWPMYFSTRHWKPVANGYSGYETRSHAELAAALPPLPDDRAFALLRRLGISHLLLRTPSEGRETLLAPWAKRYGKAGKGWIDLVYKRGSIRVYRLIDPTTGGAASSSRPNRSGR